MRTGLATAGKLERLVKYFKLIRSGIDVARLQDQKRSMQEQPHAHSTRCQRAHTFLLSAWNSKPGAWSTSTAAWARSGWLARSRRRQLPAPVLQNRQIDEAGSLAIVAIGQKLGEARASREKDDVLPLLESGRVQHLGMVRLCWHPEWSTGMPQAIKVESKARRQGLGIRKW
jgi:hypothetical protein